MVWKCLRIQGEDNKLKFVFTDKISISIYFFPISNPKTNWSNFIFNFFYQSYIPNELMWFFKPTENCKSNISFSFQSDLSSAKLKVETARSNEIYNTSLNSFRIPQDLAPKELVIDDIIKDRILSLLENWMEPGKLSVKTKIFE